MAEQLPKVFNDLESRVKDLYELIPSLVIEEEIEEDLQCVKCRNILIRAYRLQCDHHFCGACIKQMATKTKPKCPLDEKTVDPCQLMHVASEKTVERRVVNVRVQCPNPSCNSVKPIIEILEHYRNCKKVAVERKERVRTNMESESQQKSRTKPESRKRFCSKEELEHFKDDIEIRLSSVHDTINSSVDKFNSLCKQITQLQQKLDKVIETQEQMQQIISLVDSKQNKQSDWTEKTGETKKTGGQGGYIACQISNYREKCEEKNTKQILKSQTFSTLDGDRFNLDIHVENNNIGFILKLLPGQSDKNKTWPMKANVSVTMSSPSGRKWMSKMIPMQMERSVGRNRSALIVPVFISGQELNKHLSKKSAFHVEIRITPC